MTPVFSDPASNQKRDSAEKAIDRRKMEDVHVVRRKYQLADRVDILPEGRVEDQKVDRWDRKNNRRVSAREDRYRPQSLAARIRPRCESSRNHERHKSHSHVCPRFQPRKSSMLCVANY